MAHRIYIDALTGLPLLLDVNPSGVIPPTLSESYWSSNGGTLSSPNEGDYWQHFDETGTIILEKYVSSTWVKWDTFDYIKLDSNVGESMMSTGHTVVATTDEQYYKIGGVWDETPLNTGWVSTTNNHLTANVSGRYLYIGRALVSVNKPCTITLALYKNGELFKSTDYGFANSSVFATIVNTDIMSVDKDNIFELYVKSSATLTNIEIKNISIIFTEQKKY